MHSSSQTGVRRAFTWFFQGRDLTTILFVPWRKVNPGKSIAPLRVGTGREVSDPSASWTSSCPLWYRLLCNGWRWRGRWEALYFGHRAIRESEVPSSVEGLSVGHGIMGSPIRRFQSGCPKGNAGTVFENDQSNHQHYRRTKRHLPHFGKYSFLRCLFPIIFGYQVISRFV